MPGVKAILTADDLPEAQGGGTLGEGVQASNQGEKILTKEPAYEGEPILAVAAVDELTAAEKHAATGYTYDNGAQAELYSAFPEGVLD